MIGYWINIDRLIRPLIIDSVILGFDRLSNGRYIFVEYLVLYFYLLVVFIIVV